jgi:NADH-quinone oxidoreductase subunit B
MPLNVLTNANGLPVNPHGTPTAPTQDGYETLPLSPKPTFADMRDLSDPTNGKGFILHNVRDFIHEMTDGLLSWSEKKSIWPLTFGIKCCAIEMMAFGAARYDSDRMGVFFRPTPRQADLLIIAGPATIKLKHVILRLYEQMPYPKYVIAFGECAICGGPFWDSYSMINGVDKLIPVDVYVPGCPPRPEQFFLAVQKLQEKIDERSGKRKESGTAKVDAIAIAGMEESHEAILAGIMAHPTYAMGLQSGEQRYVPTPEELMHATPTGQPEGFLAHNAVPSAAPIAKPASSATAATPATASPAPSSGTPISSSGATPAPASAAAPASNAKTQNAEAPR